MLAVPKLAKEILCILQGIFLSTSLCSYKEEANADKAIKALTSALAPKAKVLRDGKVEQIDAVGLVPGNLSHSYAAFVGSIQSHSRGSFSACKKHL